jgi:hypothetical protein
MAISCLLVVTDRSASSAAAGLGGGPHRTTTPEGGARRRPGWSVVVTAGRQRRYGTVGGAVCVRELAPAATRGVPVRPTTRPAVLYGTVPSIDPPRRRRWQQQQQPAGKPRVRTRACGVPRDSRGSTGLYSSSVTAPAETTYVHGASPGPREHPSMIPPSLSIHQRAGVWHGSGAELQHRADWSWPNTLTSKNVTPWSFWSSSSILWSTSFAAPDPLKIQVHMEFKGNYPQLPLQSPDRYFSFLLPPCPFTRDATNGCLAPLANKHVTPASHQAAARLPLRRWLSPPPTSPVVATHSRPLPFPPSL